MWLLSRPTVAIWDGEGGGPGGYTARGLAAGVSIQACLIKAESCFLMLEFVIFGCPGLRHINGARGGCRGSPYEGCSRKPFCILGIVVYDMQYVHHSITYNIKYNIFVEIYNVLLEFVS